MGSEGVSHQKTVVLLDWLETTYQNNAIHLEILDRMAGKTLPFEVI